MAQAKTDVAWVPRGLRADRAALYLGLGTTKFRELVDKGTLPQPARIGGVVVWDRLALDAAFDGLTAANDNDDGWD